MTRAALPSGTIDVPALVKLVDAAYVAFDQERERNDRTSLLTCEEMDALNDQLRELAHHDPLTGLPNRLAFSEFTRSAVARSKRGEPFALLLVDLDRFKAINDTLGHAMGDALLCEVASRLKRCVREGDLVVRMGGDEFAIVQLSSNLAASAAALARRLVRSLSAPYTVRGVHMTVGASVGVVLSDLDTDIDVLLRNADQALYRAKNEGRCTWRVFEDGTVDAEAMRSVVRAEEFT